jgi:hypothetical protein
MTPFRRAFVRMMFAHAEFERRVSELVTVITQEPGFGEQPKNRFTAKNRAKEVERLRSIVRASILPACQKPKPLCDYSTMRSRCAVIGTGSLRRRALTLGPASLRQVGRALCTIANPTSISCTALPACGSKLDYLRLPPRILRLRRRHRSLRMVVPFLDGIIIVGHGCCRLHRQNDCPLAVDRCFQIGRKDVCLQR